MSLILLSTLAMAGQKELTIEVPLPSETPVAEATYSSSTSEWRARYGRVVAPLASTDGHLNCNLDGRWLTAELKFSGTEMPSADASYICENEDLRVIVIATHSGEGWEAQDTQQVADGRLVMPRKRGQLQRAQVMLPVPGLLDGEVVADVRGVACAVTQEEEGATVSVRVRGRVFKDEATCELPTQDGGSYPLTIALDSEKEG
jgi:hypothetical protein